jgi:hypothetical protein
MSPIIEKCAADNTMHFIGAGYLPLEHLHKGFPEKKTKKQQERPSCSDDCYCTACLSNIGCIPEEHDGLCDTCRGGEGK